MNIKFQVEEVVTNRDLGTFRISAMTSLTHLILYMFHIDIKLNYHIQDEGRQATLIPISLVVINPNISVNNDLFNLNFHIRVDLTKLVNEC